MVKTEFDFNLKCRACLTNDNILHHLFSEFNQELKLFDILKSTTYFQVEDNDGLSPYLCENCTSVVVNFYNFKTIYLENNNYIKAILNNENHENNSEKKGNVDVNNSNNNLAESAGSGKIHETEVEVASNQSSVSGEITELEIEGEFIQPKDILIQEISDIESYDWSKNFCEVCSDNFLLKSDFNQHMLKQHNIVVSDLEEYNSVSLAQTSNYVKCTEIIDENCIIQCDTCNDKCNTYEDFEKHCRTVHCKKYVCEHCGAAFLKRSYLNDHAEIHTTERRHVCSICGKTFRRRTVLVKHKRIHTHPRQCVCEICGLRFTDKGTLKTHIKLKHTKERNFICTVCGLRFPLKSTLMKHTNRHDENRKRQFTCTVCNMAYKDKSSLHRHFEIKHTENAKKPSCSICRKKYTTNTNLLKHMRVHHNVNFKNDSNEIIE